eukprot:scaffold2036_cov115-Isochrysis_galbana.AAC.10
MRATGGRMRHDTLLSFGGLALAPPPLSPLALDLFPVGALWPIISGCTPHAAVGGVAGPLCSLNARHASGGSTGHHCPLPTGRHSPPLPSHSYPTPFSLFRPSITEGWCPSCVHYNSLGWGIESLGFSVCRAPSYVRITLGSLRADYGGALNRCVAIIGRADQHSAGAEGAPYRLNIEGFGVCSIVLGGKNANVFAYVPYFGYVKALGHSFRHGEGPAQRGLNKDKGWGRKGQGEGECSDGRGH